MTLPTVRLRPDFDARAIRHGFPRLHAGEVVPDRRGEALDPGSFALPEDEGRRPMGVVTADPAAKVVARMMDPDPAAGIGRDRPAARLAHAGPDHPTLPQLAESGCRKALFFRLDG